MQTIKLDLQRQSILNPLKAKQNDRYSRFFKVVLLDGSTAFSIPQGAALTVRYIAPSGSGWYDTITEINGTTKHSAFAISGNEVTVELAEAMLTMPGNGMLCLQIYTATGYRIGTWNVPIEIEADPLADSTIAASDYYNVLTWQVAQALSYRDAAAQSASEILLSAEKINLNAEAIKQINNDLSVKKLSVTTGYVPLENNVFKTSHVIQMSLVIRSNSGFPPNTDISLFTISQPENIPISNIYLPCLITSVSGLTVLGIGNITISNTGNATLNTPVAQTNYEEVRVSGCWAIQ